MNLQKFSDDLVLEMNEMKKLGMKVPKKAFELATNLETIKEYENMKNSDCVDLLISLSKIQ